MKVTICRTPVWHLIIDNAFGKEANKEIFGHILQHEKDFKRAKVLGEEINQQDQYRNNLFFDIDEAYKTSGDWKERKDFRKKSPLLKAIDGLIESNTFVDLMMGAPNPFNHAKVFNTWETNISRYGHKNFYKWHVDSLGNSKRLITLVYYFGEEKSAFKGGDLMLTDGLLLDYKIVGEEQRAYIKPKNDRLVVFSSNTLHCVKYVEAPEEFRKGRFSVNCWAGVS